MKRLLAIPAVFLAALVGAATTPATTPAAAPTATTAEVMESAKPSDWRRPDPARTLYLDLAAGRVIVELSPHFAPKHTANILGMVKDKFFDGLPIARVQDNYVVQWGDVDETRPTEAEKRKIPGEVTTPLGQAKFIELPDADGYATATGWIDGFPVGVDPKTSEAWIAHCYGVVGIGRGDWPDTGSGSELYMVIGQAPRHLDRNIVTVGRVLRGAELLSSLPRGTGELGFYKTPQERTPLKSVRLESDVPAAERTPLEILRTDTPLFTRYIEARRNRRESWFVSPAAHIDICNITIPTRDAPAAAPAH